MPKNQPKNEAAGVGSTPFKQALIRHVTNFMTVEELRDLNGLIVRILNRKNTAENMMKGMKFSEGQMVEWESRKSGMKQVGKITRINRVTATVAVKDSLGIVSWKVPFSMLSVAKAWLASQEHVE